MEPVASREPHPHRTSNPRSSGDGDYARPGQNRRRGQRSCASAGRYRPAAASHRTPRRGGETGRRAAAADCRRRGQPGSSTRRDGDRKRPSSGRVDAHRCLSRQPLGSVKKGPTSTGPTSVPPDSSFRVSEPANSAWVPTSSSPTNRATAAFRSKTTRLLWWMSWKLRSMSGNGSRSAVKEAENADRRVPGKAEISQPSPPRCRYMLFSSVVRRLRPSSRAF